jgi:acetyltransferase-like isoleucine patch superfamily enzyme
LQLAVRLFTNSTDGQKIIQTLIIQCNLKFINYLRLSGEIIDTPDLLNYQKNSVMIFHDKEINSVLPDFYINRIGCKWYFEGIRPKGIVRNLKRIHIGNDVWLGKNVLITNAANIGNGVIAGAGAVITKSVPDYAVIVGVPARIIKYRYAPKQIDALNRIAWWEWSDDEIRERFEDFYLPIEEFIAKYQIDH